MRLDLIELLARGLSLTGCCLFSPTRWMMENVLSPYVRLQNTSQWASVITQMQALPPDVIRLKLLPSLVLCLILSIGYIVFCQRLTAAFSRFLKQQLISL